ncbi:WD40-repeat-containing domain protein [Lipomyces orientalis]|uniref:WD40-repeat-containing domain protein n=1 Tax=Lipomyces orientalis TaxID=1233043 RepID=A0ACC3TH56_9ASCO
MSFSTPVKSRPPVANCTPPRMSYQQPRLELSPLTPRQYSQLTSSFMSSRRRSPSGAQAKTCIHRQASSPLKLDSYPPECTLTGTGPVSSTPKRPGKKQLFRTSVQGDRFIPSRSSKSTAMSKLESESKVSSDLSESLPSSISSALSYQPNTAALAYQSSVAEACGLALNTRILAFKPEAPQSSKPIDLRSQYNRPLKPAVNAQLRRRLPTSAERILDAPGIRDDYYLNLLDWSRNNQVAIGLDRDLYVWNAESGNVSNLLRTNSDTYIAGIKWSGDGAYIAVGLSDGDVQIWDVEEGEKVRSMSGHAARVGVMSWDRHILSSGCRDGSIWNHDVRVADHKVSEFVNHQAEVCGLQWRSDGNQLASGGNDNLVNIWDARSSTPKFTKTNHKAAVKALAWCPWQLNLLATGGGTYDKHIHFWNGTTGARLNSIDTGSQVTSLQWSTTYKEIVSSHGYPDNNLAIWSYPSLVKNGEIQGHDTRILSSALSPDGSTVATVASDENLKFWKVFEQIGKKVSSAVSGTLGSSKDIAKVMMIR